MDSFFNKRKSCQEDSAPNPKRSRLDSDSSQISNLPASPTIIAAWNCNGLTARLNSPSDAQQIKQFIVKHTPHVFFLSEVRLAAANNATKIKPAPSTKWYRSRIKDADKKSACDAALVRNFFSSPELANYKVYYSLANTKYAGTAMLLNTTTTQPPKSIRYNLDRMHVKGSIHDSDGRVIVAKFGSFSILHTYSPNNGWDEQHFERRREWDAKVCSFMKRKKEAGVQIMWMGDLNVAPRDEDLSHPEYYRRQKRSAQGGSRKGVLSPAPEDVGQPGCTDRERKGLDDILAAGNMVDAFRQLHEDHESSPLTWRGNVLGKHSGRGMRIDHCIVSKTLMPMVKSMDVTGHGTDLIGFLGSDHCPILIAMTEKQSSSDSTESMRKANERDSDASATNCN